MISKAFIIVLIGLTICCIWATYTGLGLQESGSDPLNIRQESAGSRRFAGGGYRGGK